MLQKAYATSLKIKPFNISGKAIVFENNRPPSGNKYFDYLSDWYSPLEMKSRAVPLKKWLFKII